MSLFKMNPNSLMLNNRKYITSNAVKIRENL